MANSRTFGDGRLLYPANIGQHFTDTSIIVYTQVYT